MTAVEVVQFVGGVGLLVVGAELLVRGASRLATGFGVSPLVIGLTVVAFGTSAPELAVSVGAALGGSADIAIGNVVGSNIANVLLILGLSALVAPLVVDRQVVQREVPILIAVSLAFWGIAADGVVSRLDGALLCAAGVGYTGWTVRQSRKELAASDDPPAVPAGHPAANIGTVIVGLGLLVLGAQWLVDAAVIVARALGVSELLIGLTMVAVGTSLPELATSVMASLRGQRDIAVGNVVGSNLFNILVVLGLAAMLAPSGIAVAPQILRFDLPVMVAVAIATLPIALSGHRVDRWEGGLLFAWFAAYVAWQALHAGGHDLLSPFTAAMVWFALPLTAITLLASVLNASRRRQRHA